ncbi:hypothetical protein [Alicyclobacillus ferrooxydans]|uniref:hypothetical protein n=1 Tax=Alicyclobacillus ferrooxydans TaxID=471514 RepID=UPI000A6611B9|nr:hypothetical protein [Alicyclobacillus ferrooxydans]
MTIIMVCIMLVATPFAVYWNYRMSMKEPGTSDDFLWTFHDDYFSVFPVNDDMF